MAKGKQPARRTQRPAARRTAAPRRGGSLWLLVILGIAVAVGVDYAVLRPQREAAAQAAAASGAAGASQLAASSRAPGSASASSQSVSQPPASVASSSAPAASSEPIADSELLPPPAERALAAIELNEVDALVRGWRFAEAIELLEAFLERASDEEAREGASARLHWVRRYQTLQQDLIRSIQRGRMHRKPMRLPGQRLRIMLTGADDEGFTASPVEGKGRLRERWKVVDYTLRFHLMEQLGVDWDRGWSLAELSWEMDALELSERAFRAIWGKADQAQRIEISSRLAAMRGETMPEGGYTVHDDRLVPAADAAQLAKGLVRFRGEWVTPEDKQHLAKNHVKVGGRWVALTAKQMRRRGYVEYRGDWLLPADYRALRARWEHAFELTGTRWTLRTNHTDETENQRVLALLEEAERQALKLLERLLGEAPAAPQSDEPLSAYLFDGAHPWRRYCRKVGHDDASGAPGLVRYSKRRVASWPWIEDREEVLRGLVGRAARLIWRDRYPEAPYWVDRGLGAMLQGFTRKGDEVRFDFISRRHLARLAKAIKQRELLPLDHLMQADYEKLGSRRNVAKAQAWGLFYIALSGEHPRFSQAFGAALKAAAAGEQPALQRAIGDVPAFERDFRNTIRKLAGKHGRGGRSWVGTGCKR